MIEISLSQLASSEYDGYYFKYNDADYYFPLKSKEVLINVLKDIFNKNKSETQYGIEIEICKAKQMLDIDFNKFSALIEDTYPYCDNKEQIEGFASLESENDKITNLYKEMCNNVQKIQKEIHLSGNDFLVKTGVKFKVIADQHSSIKRLS